MSENEHPENEILAYIEKHGIEHKDYTPRKKHGKKGSYEKRGKKYRKILDLHGKRYEEAVPIIREAIHECRDRGVDSMLIIHGVGYGSDIMEGPVIKKLVHNMLAHELSNYVKDFRAAIPKDGGEGATVVKLK